MVFGNFSNFEHFFGDLRVELGVRPKKISDSEKPLEQETFLVRGHWSTFEAVSAVATLAKFGFSLRTTYSSRI